MVADADVDTTVYGNEHINERMCQHERAIKKKSDAGNPLLYH